MLSGFVQDCLGVVIVVQLASVNFLSIMAICFCPSVCPSVYLYLRVSLAIFLCGSLPDPFNRTILTAFKHSVYLFI